jgi:membrane protease YdiL (CAAX protease family)
LVAAKFPLPTIPEEINYRALGGFLQTVTLRYLPFSIIFLIAPPFLILSYNNRQIQKLEVSPRDIWALVILYIFSYFQMAWVGTSLQTFLYYNPLFYLHFIFTIWIFVILPLVLFLVQRPFPRELIGFSLRVKWKDIKYFLFTVPFCIFLFVFSPSPFKPISLNQPTLFTLDLVYSIFAIAIPAELLFRGLFINIIAEKLKNSKIFSEDRISLAVIISSILYALTHYWNGLGAIGGQFLIGIVFGIIFVKTKSLIAPILIHTLLSFVGHSAPIGG